MAKGLNPGRLAAGRALVAVDGGTHVEDVLGAEAIEPRDRALAWHLALGVLRRRGQVDAALQPFLKQPIGALDPEVRAALRVGAFEKLFSHTPERAAVHQGVELVAHLGARRAKGLVNAILRRAVLHEDMSRAEQLNHPEWLVDRWTERFGVEAVDRWCEANAEPPPLILVLADPDIAQTWAAQGLDVQPVSLSGQVIEGVVRLKGHRGPIPALQGFEEGAFWVQDTASVAVTDMVLNAKGKRVLDACAAPGGKTFRLLHRGADVISVDLSPARLDLLQESAHRLDCDAITHAHDWADGTIEDLGTFDAVLVDAPCTGLGTVRRHPGVRWRRHITDVLAMAQTQADVLRAASAHVGPGGQLVYAVCSVEPEEGPAIVQAFLAEHGDYRLDAELCTAPPQGDEDGFYGARMVRQ